MPDIVTVKGLTKTYGKVRAVDGIGFTVAEGEIFGFVGPNGAGKTTTWEILEGLRTADAGEVRVAGFDMRRGPREARNVLGIQLQATALFEKLTVRETLHTFGKLYDQMLPVPKLLDLVNLEEKADAFTETLSGGQKQRLAVALALVNDPKVVFLDEPTTGLDPQARRSLWEVIEGLRETGKTIMLTTHYMEEAERLCDRVGVIDHGKILALDSPKRLVQGLGRAQAVEFTANGGDAEAFTGLPGIDEVKVEDGVVILYTKHLEASLPAVFAKATERDLRVEDLRIRAPNLEDVFIALTGRRLRE